MLEKMKVLYGKKQEVIDYLIFGALTTAVNWVTFQLLNAVLMVPWGAANTVAWIVSVVFAYITNRRYVFRSKNQKILREFLLFVQCRVVSFLMETLALYLLIEICSFAPFFAKVIAAVIVVTANYVFSKVAIFK